MSKPEPKQDNRKSKLYNSRTIRSELGDGSFTNGILNVPDFLKSREFEIKSLELAQLKSKYAASTRSFQALPRVLRRRTASHNVKRIPKRLRAKTIREMQNSTNGIIATRSKPKRRDVYKLKMRSKLLKLGSRLKLMGHLPVVVAGNLKIRNQIKLLQEEIDALQQGKTTSDATKLNNTIGSYDNTALNVSALPPKGNLKYTKRQKQYVWLPTHIWHAKRAHMVKRYGYQIPLKPTQKCFKSINRDSKLGNGAVVYDTSYYNSMILEVKDYDRLVALVCSLINKKKLSAKLTQGLRSYDGWLYFGEKAIGTGLILFLPENSKVLIRLHPSIYDGVFDHILSVLDPESDLLQDCRYSLGSIDITGPSSLISLAKIIHPTNKLSNSWSRYCQFIDNHNFPVGTTFSFDVYDPRLWDKPTDPPAIPDTNLNDLIISSNDLESRNLFVDPVALQNLFDPTSRNQSYTNQPSIKQLSKRRINPGKAITPTSADPRIPILITKLSTTNNWTLILPWFWVLPFWFNLNKLPNLQFGGIRQLHQLNFENYKPSYPVDYPFLPTGFVEETLKIKESKKKYAIKPSGVKMNYGKLGEVGSWFGCDWRFLQLLKYGLAMRSQSPSLDTDVDMDGTLTMRSLFQDVSSKSSLDDVTKLIERIAITDEEKEARGESIDVPIVFLDKKTRLTPLAIDTVDPQPLPVIQIKLELVKRGHIEDGARIYRIPSEQYHLWSDFATNKESVSAKLEALGTPGVENLIGFVTSGSFNLNLGSSSGIGCIGAHYGREVDVYKYVLVRNIGSQVPRIAGWAEIH